MLEAALQSKLGQLASTGPLIHPVSLISKCPPAGGTMAEVLTNSFLTGESMAGLKAGALHAAGTDGMKHHGCLKWGSLTAPRSEFRLS